MNYIKEFNRIKKKKIQLEKDILAYLRDNIVNLFKDHNITVKTNAKGDILCYRVKSDKLSHNSNKYNFTITSMLKYFTPELKFAHSTLTMKIPELDEVKFHLKTETIAIDPSIYIKDFSQLQLHIEDFKLWFEKVGAAWLKNTATYWLDLTNQQFAIYPKYVLQKELNVDPDIFIKHLEDQTFIENIIPIGYPYKANYQTYDLQTGESVTVKCKKLYVPLIILEQDHIVIQENELDQYDMKMKTLYEIRLDKNKLFDYNSRHNVVNYMGYFKGLPKVMISDGIYNKNSDHLTDIFANFKHTLSYYIPWYFAEKLGYTSDIPRHLYDKSNYKDKIKQFYSLNSYIIYAKLSGFPYPIFAQDGENFDDTRLSDEDIAQWLKHNFLIYDVVKFLEKKHKELVPNLASFWKNIDLVYSDEYQHIGNIAKKQLKINQK